MKVGFPPQKPEQQKRYRADKEHPRRQDVEALHKLLNENKSLELWRDVLSAAQYAERTVLEDSPGVPGLKECWKQRLSTLRKELGIEAAPVLEQLLIQNAALCWLQLSLVELQYSHAMKRSITLAVGMYWEKRLSVVQKRFPRACETLARIRKL